MKTLLVGVVLGVLVGLATGFVWWGNDGQWVHADKFNTLYHSKTGEVKSY